MSEIFDEHAVSDLPLCVKCQYFHRMRGIGGSHFCNAPERGKTFDPVYGFHQVSKDPWSARTDNRDCGPTGKWWEPKTPEKIEEEKEEEIENLSKWQKFLSGFTKSTK